MDVHTNLRLSMKSIHLQLVSSIPLLLDAWIMILQSYYRIRTQYPRKQLWVLPYSCKSILLFLYNKAVPVNMQWSVNQFCVSHMPIKGSFSHVFIINDTRLISLRAFAKFCSIFPRFGMKVTLISLQVLGMFLRDKLALRIKHSFWCISSDPFCSIIG